MTDAPNKPDVPVPAPAPAKPTPGEYLRKLREEKGYTHAAVGTALHLTVHYVKALEGDEYGKLPGLTFVKGYLRAYARFLGADVDNVLARFDEHIANLLDAGMHTARVQRSRRRQDQALRWGIGAGVVVVAGLVAGWWFMSERDAPAAEVAAALPQAAAVTPQAQTPNRIPPRTSPPVTATFSPPAAAEVSATTPDAVLSDEAPAATGATTITANANGARQVSLVSVGEDELRVTFNGNSWIEVDDAGMARLYNDMLSAGDTLTIRGAAPFHVLLGDARQVSVAVNALAIDISGDIRADSTARLVLDATSAEARP